MAHTVRVPTLWDDRYNQAPPGSVVGYQIVIRGNGLRFSPLRFSRAATYQLLGVSLGSGSSPFCGDFGWMNFASDPGVYRVSVCGLLVLLSPALYCRPCHIRPHILNLPNNLLSLCI